MKSEEHKQLHALIERAKGEATGGSIEIAIVEELYCEHDRERFNYCPTRALSTLYRPGWFALIGIAYPGGRYLTALELIDEMERAAR